MFMSTLGMHKQIFCQCFFYPLNGLQLLIPQHMKSITEMCNLAWKIMHIKSI